MDAFAGVLALAVVFLGPSALVLWSERRTNGPINPKAIREMIAIMPEAQDAIRRIEALERTMTRMEQEHL